MVQPTTGKSNNINIITRLRSMSTSKPSHLLEKIKQEWPGLVSKNKAERKTQKAAILEQLQPKITEFLKKTIDNDDYANKQAALQLSIRAIQYEVDNKEETIKFDQGSFHTHDPKLVELGKDIEGMSKCDQAEVYKYVGILIGKESFLSKAFLIRPYLQGLALRTKTAFDQKFKKKEFSRDLINLDKSIKNSKFSVPYQPAVNNKNTFENIHLSNNFKQYMQGREITCNFNGDEIAKEYLTSQATGGDKIEDKNQKTWLIQRSGISGLFKVTFYEPNKGVVKNLQVCRCLDKDAENNNQSKWYVADDIKPEKLQDFISMVDVNPVQEKEIAGLSYFLNDVTPEEFHKFSSDNLYAPKIGDPVALNTFTLEDYIKNKPILSNPDEAVATIKASKKMWLFRPSSTQEAGFFTIANYKFADGKNIAPTKGSVVCLKKDDEYKWLMLPTNTRPVEFLKNIKDNNEVQSALKEGWELFNDKDMEKFTTLINNNTSDENIMRNCRIIRDLSACVTNKTEGFDFSPSALYVPSNKASNSKEESEY